MSPVKTRRRLPTLVDRGLGLLEVILPCGASSSDESALPPGQRDNSGFWFPAGYDKPADIFTPLQRELQENQRRIQRRRVQAKSRPGGPVTTERAVPANGSSGGAHRPPAAALAIPGYSIQVEPQASIPLPPLRTESHLPPPPAASPGLHSPAGPPLLPKTETRAPLAVPLIVDSREGSD